MGGRYNDSTILFGIFKCEFTIDSVKRIIGCEYPRLLIKIKAAHAFAGQIHSDSQQSTSQQSSSASLFESGDKL